MKYVVEFGVRGGAHTENLIVASGKAAEELAAKLVMVFENDPHASGADVRDWMMYKHIARKAWQTETHFVAISRLDGVMRGPASPALWRKSDKPTFMRGQVIDTPLRS